jgi:hypothetical protein
MAGVSWCRLPVVGVAAVLLAGGCASTATFDDGSLDELESGLDAAGLSVCEESTDDVDMPGARTTTTYELAFDCDTDDTAFVAATEYDTRDHRDGAAAQYASQPTRGLEAVWTLGPYTVVLSGPRDDDVADAVTETLDDLGAR